MKADTMAKKRTGWFKRILRISFWLGVVAGLSVIAINIYIISFSKDNIISKEQASTLEVDCILILGAGLYSESTPSPMLADRIKTGINLYELNASKKILMSGDHGQHNHDEVGVMRDYAIKAGVPSEDIFMDHAGFSTYESMYRAKYIFGAKKIIIVTQDFHISRAVYIAEKLGLEAYGVTSDLRIYKGIWYNRGRDVLARVKDFFMVIFKPEPTYLGETISLKGNGEVTLG